MFVILDSQQRSADQYTHVSQREHLSMPYTLGPSLTSLLTERKPVHAETSHSDVTVEVGSVFSGRTASAAALSPYAPLSNTIIRRSQVVPGSQRLDSSIKLLQQRSKCLFRSSYPDEVSNSGTTPKQSRRRPQHSTESFASTPQHSTEEELFIDPQSLHKGGDTTRSKESGSTFALSLSESQRSVYKFPSYTTGPVQIRSHPIISIGKANPKYSSVASGGGVKVTSDPSSAWTSVDQLSAARTETHGAHFGSLGNSYQEFKVKPKLQFWAQRTTYAPRQVEVTMISLSAIDFEIFYFIFITYNLA